MRKAMGAETTVSFINHAGALKFDVVDRGSKLIITASGDSELRNICEAMRFVADELDRCHQQ